MPRFDMEITVAWNAEEIFSLSDFRKSTSPRPRPTGNRIPSNIPPQPRKDAIPKYAMMGNTPTAASNGRAKRWGPTLSSTPTPARNSRTLRRLGA